MGVILNPGASAFLSARRLNIYVDKSDMISRIIPFVGTADKYLCVSRPRRFGKSFMANMLSAYFDNTVDGHEAFKGLTGPAWVDTMFFYRQKLIYAGR